MNQPSIFHAGELHAQQQTGVLEKMAGIGARSIRTVMPEQHQQFFAQLPFIVVGSQDADGQPWASILTGQPGFVTAPHERLLRVRARPHTSDPLHTQLREGAALGLLGIEPHTRRRNRANGVVSTLQEDGFDLDIRQSFGNCPKYIQARQPLLLESEAQHLPHVVQSTSLTPAMQAMIAAADTCFIATALSQINASHGADVSHRGGKPGFIRVDDSSTLTLPDFVGNSFFNTIGNLLLHPRAGLLFIDFAYGDLLYLAVKVEVIWEGAQVAAYTGAQRLLRCSVMQARLVSEILPLRWSAATQSPFLDAMGNWT